MAAIFSNQAGGKTISSVRQKHDYSGSQGPSCDSVEDSSVALVALEAFRPAVVPDTVELTGIAEATDIADTPGFEPVAVLNSQAVAEPEQRTVSHRRMVNHPARSGHHQSMNPLRVQLVD